MNEVVLSPEEARLQGFIPLADAVSITGEDRSTLWRKATAGQISSCLVKKGSRPVNWVLQSALGSKTSVSRVNDYETFKTQFLQQMRSGAFTGKPLSRSYVEGVLEYGLQQYWSILDQTPTIAGLNANNYSKVIDSQRFRVDEVNRKDHFSNKMHVYRACTRFLDYLISLGLRTKIDKEGFKPPKKHYKPQKRMLEEELIQEAISFNRNWYDGRKQYDIDSLDLLLHLYAFAGLRRMGPAHLRLSDIDFENDLMVVMEKGSKERFVPLNLFPELKPKLLDWVKNSRLDNKAGLLITQENGQPLTETSINLRFSRLRLAMNYRKAYVKIQSNRSEPLPASEAKAEAKRLAKTMKAGVRPHDLRRSFATILAKRGMPMSMIQLILGHEDLKTTQGYVLMNIQQVMDWTSKATPSSAATKPRETLSPDQLFAKIEKQLFG